MAVHLDVPCTPYDTSNEDIITFAQFKEGSLLFEMYILLSETHDDTKSGDESDEDSIMPPLISEEEMDTMSSGDEYDVKPMSTEMLEYIRDGNQSHTRLNRREAHYKMCVHIKQSQAEWIGALLSTRRMGKGLPRVFKAVVNDILRVLPILGESGSESSYFIPEPRNFAAVTRLSEDIKKP